MSPRIFRGIGSGLVAGLLCRQAAGGMCGPVPRFASCDSGGRSPGAPRRPVVVCGPSGVGKGTLLGKLMADFPNEFGFSVSHTTRAPREGEQDGVHYHFVTKEEMEAAIARGEFVEYAHVHTNIYGTSIASVKAVRAPPPPVYPAHPRARSRPHPPRRCATRARRACSTSTCRARRS